MINSFPPPRRAADNKDSGRDTAFGSATEIWFGPDFDPSVLDNAEHVMVEGVPDPLNPFAEPDFETVIASEDDFEDDCPLCEMMRERVRAGEQIEIAKIKW